LTDQEHAGGSESAGPTEEQARAGILAALEQHRKAALAGDAAAMEATLFADGPYFAIFKEYFCGRTGEGYTRYEMHIRSIKFNDDRTRGYVELDTVLQFKGFDPQEMRYSFTFILKDGRWLLVNVWEYRLHLLQGFEPDTLDRRPVVVPGNSEAGRRLADWLAGHLDGEVLPAAEFQEAWGDALLIDVGGDNPVAREVCPQGSGLLQVYGREGCTRWATVLRADEPGEGLDRLRDRAVEALQRREAPPLGDAEPLPPRGTDEYRRLTPPTLETGIIPEGQPAWLAAARAARDPGDPADYARAVLKWYRFVLPDARLDPAVVTANLMSRRLAETAYRILGPTPGTTFRNLARYAQTHLQHADREFPHHREPFGEVRFYPVNPSIGFDEMLAFYPDRGRAFGMCGPLQYVNLALLRFCGWEPDEAVQIRIVVGELRHEVLCVTIAGATYLCTGIEYLPMKNNFYRFSRITHIFTDRHYRGFGGPYNMSDARLDRTFTQFVKPLSHNFYLGDDVLASRPDDYRPDLVPPTLRATVWDYPGPDELAAAVRERVFAYSATYPDSHYTLAKYAYQTLFVTRPEAYPQASIMAPLARRQAKEFEGPEAALAWVAAEVRDGAVFPEGHRIQYGDQVLVYRFGTPRDRAMLGYALLHHLGVPAHIVLGSRGGGYLLYREGDRTVLHDCGEGREIADLPEPPAVVFNEAECHFPEMDRWEVDPAVADRLGLAPGA